MSEDPTMLVETDGVSIQVTDRRTASLALEEIDRVLCHYMGQTAHVERRETTERRQYEPVAVECDECGYEWEFRGKNPKHATCPECNGYTRFDPPLDERGVRP